MNIRILLLALPLAGCGGATKTAPATPTTVHVRPGPAPAGLEQVIGQNARSLTSLFGQASQDMREANARKLQFVGSACVLDAYLYAPASGKEPVVTHVDARRPDGADTDRAACVTALEKH